MKMLRLEDVAWAAGVQRQINLDVLPGGMRCRRLLMFFCLTGTKDSADALAAALFSQSVAMCTLHKFLRIPGWHLQCVNESEHKRVPNLGAAIPGSGTTFAMEFFLEVPFRDSRQPGNEDGSIPTELLQSHQLEIEFAAANVHGVGNLVITAGTVRTFAELVHGSSVPQLEQIGYYDPGSQSIKLDAGVYKDILVCDGTTPGTVTRAEISHVDFDVDGDQVWANATHDQIVGRYNMKVQDTASELALNAATFMPVESLEPHGKGPITKAPAIEKSGYLQLTGTITAPRILYRRALEKDENTLEAIAAATGAAGIEPETYEPQTATKSPVRALHKAQRQGRYGRKARLTSRVLPGKFRRTPTPGKKAKV